MSFKNRLETEYIQLFTQSSEEVIKQIILFIESTDFELGIKLGKKFRGVCSHIGHDPRFTGMMKFLSVVRNTDRKIEDIISRIHTKTEKLADVEPKSSNTTPIEKFAPLYMSFYHKVDTVTYQVYNSHQENNKESNLISQLLNKLHTIIKPVPPISPEITAAEQYLIDQFRKSELDWTYDQRREIYQPISIQDDMNLFMEYSAPIERELFDWESRGWYNSAKYVTSLWIDYLEKIAKYHEKIPEIVEIVRTEYNKMTDWLGRLETKYENRPQLEMEGGYFLSENMRQMIEKYKYMRRSFRIAEENKRILKILRSQFPRTISG